MNSRLAIVTFVDGPSAVDPGYGQGTPGGRPDNSLPSAPGRPDNSLPGSQPGIDNSLPGFPGLPVQLPVYPFDPTIDNSLPTPPASTKPIFLPGAKFVLKFLACKGLILVPDNSLPTTPTTPDNTLPPTATPK